MSDKFIINNDKGGQINISGGNSKINAKQIIYKDKEEIIINETIIDNSKNEDVIK